MCSYPSSTLHYQSEPEFHSGRLNIHLVIWFLPMVPDEMCGPRVEPRAPLTTPQPNDTWGTDCPTTASRCPSGLPRFPPALAGKHQRRDLTLFYEPGSPPMVVPSPFSPPPPPPPVPSSAPLCLWPTHQLLFDSPRQPCLAQRVKAPQRNRPRPCMWTAFVCGVRHARNVL